MTDPDLGRLQRDHVCKHGVRWPHACQPCDDAAWEARPMTDPTSKLIEALEPCPFCNSPDVSISFSATMHNPDPASRFVECEDCGASGPFFSVQESDTDMNAQSAAIAAWNRRAPKETPDDVSAGVVEVRNAFLNLMADADIEEQPDEDAICYVMKFTDGSLLPLMSALGIKQALGTMWIDEAPFPSQESPLEAIRRTIDEVPPLAQSPTPLAHSEALEAAVEVHKIETVTGDFFQDEGKPFWRIQIGDNCADFDYELAAQNFAQAILALRTPIPQ